MVVGKPTTIPTLAKPKHTNLQVPFFIFFYSTRTKVHNLVNHNLVNFR